MTGILAGRRKARIALPLVLAFGALSACSHVGSASRSTLTQEQIVASSTFDGIHASYKAAKRHCAALPGDQQAACLEDTRARRESQLAVAAARLQANHAPSSHLVQVASEGTGQE